MSESHRDYDKSSNMNLFQTHRNNSNNESERYNNRKRSHLDLETIDAKVYIRNIPTKKVTDEELLSFFKPFGKISDIQVFKDHIFVQYNRIDDAKQLLIQQAQIPLIFKGNKLDILPAREVRSTSAKSSTSTDRSSKRSHEGIFHRPSSTYEPVRKRFPVHEQSTFLPPTDRIGSDTDNRNYMPVSKLDAHRSLNESIPVNHQVPYAILTGPKNPKDFVDCQIVIVNVRQRDYAEEIESRLCSHGLVTSVILLREDYTLTEAIENAARLQCLYGIIIMPMHEERRTASFHILYGQTEEHRNLTLEDGIHIIITNFISYKERLHNEEVNSYQPNNEPIVYPNPNPSYEYHRQSTTNLPQEELSPPVLNLGDKLPLSMLLCLLADGRQLTLEEIDRVLVYLLEKKAKMLTLPPGTLPPLPAQYAVTTTTYNHQTGSGMISDTRSMSTSDPSPGKCSSSSTETSASIAEQIRQILSTNTIKSNSSTRETNSQSIMTNLSDNIKIENTILPQVTNNGQDAPKEYVQQHKIQPSFSYSKSESMPSGLSAFNYTSPSVTTNGSLATPSFSSYTSVTPSLSMKSTPSVTVPNFVPQSSPYFYPLSSQTVYQSPLNSTAANTAAALFQAYTQFNVQPTATPSIVNQQQQQQQQMRK